MCMKVINKKLKYGFGPYEKNLAFGPSFSNIMVLVLVVLNFDPHKYLKYVFNPYKY